MNVALLLNTYRVSQSGCKYTTSFSLQPNLFPKKIENIFNLLLNTKKSMGCTLKKNPNKITSVPFDSPTLLFLALWSYR